MNLADERRKELDNPSLTTNERILLRLSLADELIQIGQYEGGCEALGDLWCGIGKRPNVEGLKDVITAEVLLQCGTLSGLIGASRQVADSQEAAKDLISDNSGVICSDNARVVWLPTALRIKHCLVKVNDCLTVSFLNIFST